MITLFIYNNVNYHYEIIESVIVNYCKIINKLNEVDKSIINIYLECYENKIFKKYIAEKYPNIKLQKPETYDYFINCTIYEKNLLSNSIKLNSKKHYYISHEVTDKLLQYDNLYYLTDLANKNIFHATILPFCSTNNGKIKDITKPPIFVIQGAMNPKRRDYKLLVKLLSTSYQYDFKVELIGKLKLPKILYPFKERLIIKHNLNFIDFHKKFLDCYGILPLITKTSHSQYYSRKLTSSINYAKAYNLKCLIDKDLQDIYHLDNVEVFNDITDIVSSFFKILKEYYNNN